MPVNSPYSQGASSCHSRQKIKKIPGKAELTCPTGKGAVTKGRSCPELDLVCDYTCILITEMLTLKI